MTPEELVEFQEEFKTIDNNERLRKWFLDYPEMSGSERSLISGMTFDALAYYREKFKLIRTVIVETDEGIIIETPPRTKKQPLTMPPGLSPAEREEWIVHQAVHHKRSMNELATAVNRSRSHIRTVLKNHSLLPSQPVNNQYKNREWLVEHYITKTLSIRKCAAIANVPRSAINRWLNYFGIPTRDAFEANAVLDKKTRKSTGPPPPRRQSKITI